MLWGHTFTYMPEFFMLPWTLFPKWFGVLMLLCGSLTKFDETSFPSGLITATICYRSSVQGTRIQDASWRVLPLINCLAENLPVTPLNVIEVGIVNSGYCKLLAGSYSAGCCGCRRWTDHNMMFADAGHKDFIIIVALAPCGRPFNDWPICLMACVTQTDRQFHRVGCCQYIRCHYIVS
jgi:hypothetical protein